MWSASPYPLGAELRAVAIKSCKRRIGFRGGAKIARVLEPTLAAFAPLRSAQLINNLFRPSGFGCKRGQLEKRLERFYRR
jgi:hypothetical protein